MRVGGWVVGVSFVLGCGTVLRATDEPLTSDKLAQLGRGAAALACRPQHSAEFALFVVCPPKAQTLGISATEGMTTLTCVDLVPRHCKRLAERLLEAGRTESRASP